MNLNRPTIKSGPLTLAELQDSRRERLAGFSAFGDWPPRRAMPYGLDQQGRLVTRAVPTQQWPDTIPTDHAELQPGPAEAATDVGAEPGELDAAPELLASLVGPALIVLAAAVSALLLAGGWPVAWPLG